MNTSFIHGVSSPLIEAAILQITCAIPPVLLPTVQQSFFDGCRVLYGDDVALAQRLLKGEGDLLCVLHSSVSDAIENLQEEYSWPADLLAASYATSLLKLEVADFMLKAALWVPDEDVVKFIIGHGHAIH